MSFSFAPSRGKEHATRALRTVSAPSEAPRGAAGPNTGFALGTTKDPLLQFRCQQFWSSEHRGS